MTTKNEVLRIAEGELGTKEWPKGTNKVKYCDWYGLRGAWCAMFVSWVLAAAGLGLNISTSRGFAYCPSGVSWFKRQGRWQSHPEIGALVFFQFPGGEARPNHVGIVSAIYSDGSIETIEGNTDTAGSPTGGQVMRRRRKAFIVGYGRPPYGALPSSPPPPSPIQIIALDGPWKGKVAMLPMLKEGSSGHYVKEMQALLAVHARDLCGDLNGFIDGVFGPGTERALRNWQARTGKLSADGVCGPATWAWLVGV